MNVEIILSLRGAKRRDNLLGDLHTTGLQRCAHNASFSIAKRSIKKYTIAVVITLLSCSYTQGWAINSPYKALEVVGPVGKNLNSKAILKVAAQCGLPASAVYQWKNHLVLFGKLTRLNLLQHVLADNYPKCDIKTYNNPFYVFDRHYCDNKGVVKDWDNILLTANLVADPKMQDEYLNYHATQFQKWPEVSRGFCNAQFQQLLVFKNGRQLMLVISIPKGANLDKLNPLTTKNNPRVDDWNKLMSKYQEGIPGTKKGETWVFLKEVRKTESR